MPGPGVIPTETIYGIGDWSITITFDNPATGTPADLVADGWSNWRAQWRPEAGSANFLDLSVDTTQASAGKITLTLTDAQVQQMGRKGGWDLVANDAGGNPTPHLTQQLGWQQGYTR